MAKEPIALRALRAEIDAIDARAEAAGMSRNAYMIRASLGELDDPSAVDTRLADIEDRLGRLEHYQGLGA